MKIKRLLQIELVLSDGKVANVSRSDSGELLIHIAFDTNESEINHSKAEAGLAFIEAEKVINK